ncbi:probable fumarate hydratase, mitochondrial [Drosophila innubila]|uniref:probable fumarate hydratase, mitochondrial n=1 Tax=Drosophila innubila TaxID=198719 RepID=UPI00148E2FF5|nr:probable fumarate hydratase, mitochondrial [Drosophila innubila]
MSFDQKEIFNIIYKLARLTQTEMRVELDAMGAVNVPLDRLYGRHTTRALKNFTIGGIEDRMPRAIIIALGLIKKAASITNRSFGLEPNVCDAISIAADDVISGKLYDEHHFPLGTWQEGAGAHSNMNVNEVVCNRAIQLLRGQIGGHFPVHPQTHVNLAHSPHDSFSSAINIAVAMELQKKLFPSILLVIDTLTKKEQLWRDIIKMGRTHLMDAVPLTLGQEFGGYRQMMDNCSTRLGSALKHLYQLSLGGTSVGTGANSPDQFGIKCVGEIAKLTKLPFVCAPNLFEAIGSRDSLVEIHGELNSIAVSTMKIANDIMFMASGPNCGLGEIELPKNEPGSSIMPGMVNPTQCEAMLMICAQVMGNQTAVTVGGYNGHFELNSFMPVIASNVLRSINLLSSGLKNFSTNCLVGIEPNMKRLEKTLNESLMLVAAITNHIGYDRAAEIAKAANINGTTVKKEAIRGGIVKEDIDMWLNPSNMLGPSE